jgi:hypothetical protein
MTDRLSDLHRQLADELEHLGLHVRQMEAAVGVLPDEHIDDEGNTTYVPRVDLHDTDDFQGTMIDGVKSGDVKYGINIVCTVNQLAWSDRILDPGKYEMDMQAEILLGTNDDAIAAYVASEVEKGVDPKDIRIPKGLLEGDS